MNKTICILLAMAIPVMASNTYTESVTSVNSKTITAATSGMTSASFGVWITDVSGVKQPTSAYSYTINSSTYAIDLTFSETFTGTIHLKGVYPGPDTTHSYDFQMSLDQDVEDKIDVCVSCEDTSSGHARRTYQSVVYVSTKPSSAIGSCNGSYFAYILDNQLYIATNNFSSACLTNPQNVKLAYGFYQWPIGSVPLGYAIRYDGVFGSLQDVRPF